MAVIKCSGKNKEKLLVQPGQHLPAHVYNRKSTRCEIWWKLTIKAPDNAKDVFWCLYCYFWTYYTPFSSIFFCLFWAGKSLLGILLLATCLGSAIYDYMFNCGKMRCIKNAASVAWRILIWVVGIN